jgi:hypothetical protein
VLGKSDGAVSVLALSVAARADGAPMGGRLPGTGALAFPFAAVALGVAALVVKRTVRVQ